jgi:hypothetical protein
MLGSPLTLPRPTSAAALTSSSLGARPLHQHALLGGWPLDPPHLSGLTEELWGHVQIGGWGPPGAGCWGCDWRQIRSQLVDGTHWVCGEGCPAQWGGGCRRGCAGEGCGPSCGGCAEGWGGGWAWKREGTHNRVTRGPGPITACPGRSSSVSLTHGTMSWPHWACEPIPPGLCPQWVGGGGGEHIKLKVSKNPAVGLRAPGRAEVGDSGLLPSYTLPSAGGRGGGLGPPLPRLGWIGLRGAVPGWHRAAGSQMRLSALQSSLFLLYSTRLGRPQAFCSI